MPYIIPRHRQIKWNREISCRNEFSDPENPIKDAKPNRFGQNSSNHENRIFHPWGVQIPYPPSGRQIKWNRENSCRNEFSDPENPIKDAKTNCFGQNSSNDENRIFRPLGGYLQLFSEVRRHFSKNRRETPPSFLIELANQAQFILTQPPCRAVGRE